jgi:hypothetical protein
MTYKVVSVNITHIPTNTVFTGFLTSAEEAKLCKFSKGDCCLEVFSSFFKKDNTLAYSFTLGSDIGAQSTIEIIGVSSFDDINIQDKQAVAYTK